MFLVVFAAPHFEYLNFFAAAVGENGRLDARTRNNRLTYANAFAVSDHQNVIENHLCADVRRYLFYLEFFTRGNAVLLATGFYDRVHRDSNAHCRKKFVILRPYAGHVKATHRRLLAFIG